ncbi:MAG: HEAT repeat domain-containing protein [Gammaproteobacteria bacterium]
MTVLAPISTVAGSADSIEVRINDGLLTVMASDVRFDMVLQEVGREADFTTVIYGEITDQTDSWSLTDVPLLEGIRRLAGINGMMVVNDPESDGRSIKKVYIYMAEPQTADKSAPHPPARIERYSRYLDDSGQGSGQLQAIERLEGLNSPDVVDSLEAALRTDADPAIRSRASVALEDIGGDDAVNALLAGLGDDTPAIRITVVDSLGRLGGDQAIMALGQTIMGDKDPEVRRAAVLALEGHEGGAVDAFITAAAKDRSEKVREAAQMLNAQ